MTFCSRIRGFTLVEVMVSIAIMGLVVTAAFSSLGVGLDSWERGSNEIEMLEQRNTIERLLKRQLAVAYPMEFSSEDVTFTMFRGTPTQLEFVSDYSLVDGPADFRKIDYAMDQGRFLYGERPLFTYVPQDVEPLPSNELAVFQTVAFRFLGADEDSNLAWVDEWPVERGLPEAVQVNIDEDVFVIRLVNR